MRFQFKFKNGVRELWELAMIHQYTSMIGVVNVVFTVSMAVLLATSYNNSWVVLSACVAIAMLYFPVIQPIIIYFRSKKNAEKIVDETELSFTENEIFIKVGNEHQTLTWKDIPGMKELPGLFILYTGRGHGLVIPDKSMGNSRKDFVAFVKEKLQKK